LLHCVFPECSKNGWLARFITERHLRYVNVFVPEDDVKAGMQLPRGLAEIVKVGRKHPAGDGGKDGVGRGCAWVGGAVRGSGGAKGGVLGRERKGVDVAGGRA
jgi:hypothetical protein